MSQGDVEIARQTVCARSNPRVRDRAGVNNHFGARRARIRGRCAVMRLLQSRLCVKHAVRPERSTVTGLGSR